MLVCFHRDLSFWLLPVGWKKDYRLEMEKIVLILIYLTWFLSSLLPSCNVYAVIMNLAYFNPHICN